MELLDGELLAQRLDREGHLEPGEAFAILAQVCSALDAAHRRGVVHRDIKPDNIYLSLQRLLRYRDAAGTRET